MRHLLRPRSIVRVAPTALVTLLLLRCGSTDRKFSSGATGGNAGQGGAMSQGGKSAAGSGGTQAGSVGDGGAPPTGSGGALTTGGGGTDTSSAGDATLGGGGQNTTSPEGGAAGAPSQLCKDGERSCIDMNTARACVGGRWVQEACQVSEASHVSACSAGICGEACPAKTQECNGACVDVQSSTDHCGSCDHSCGGGACTKGSCEPQVVVSAQDGAFALALTPDGLGVFWARPNGLFRCPVSGCAANKAFVVADVQNTLSRPYTIVTDNTNVYWLANSSTLHNCPAAGCNYQVPSTSADITGYQARELTQRGGYRYVVDKFTVLECLGSGCTAYMSSCVSGDSLQSLALSESAAFWGETTDPWGLYSCSFSAGAKATRLTSVSGGQVVRVLGSMVYVMSATAQKIYACGTAGCGGLESDIATGLPGLTSMAVDASGVFFSVAGSDSAPTGSILACPLTGCTGAPRVLASSQARPTSVHVANGYVYWTSRGNDGVTDSGAIMRVRL